MCYNCDETFKLGHKWKQQQCYMLAVGEEEEEVFHDPEVVLKEHGEEMEISVHALYGNDLTPHYSNLRNIAERHFYYQPY